MSLTLTHTTGTFNSGTEDGDAIIVDVTDDDAIAVQLVNNSSANLQCRFEGSLDGTNWDPIYLLNADDYLDAQYSVLTALSGLYFLQPDGCNALKWFRVKALVSDPVTGSVNVTVQGGRLGR